MFLLFYFIILFVSLTEPAACLVDPLLSITARTLRTFTHPRVIGQVDAGGALNTVLFVERAAEMCVMLKFVDLLYKVKGHKVRIFFTLQTIIFASAQF